MLQDFSRVTVSKQFKDERNDSTDNDMYNGYIRGFKDWTCGIHG